MEDTVTAHGYAHMRWHGGGASPRGLRPTRQRVELGRVLFAKGDRHISAEDLHAEAELAGVRVSLATVYNALHQFTEAGLLREVAIDGTPHLFRHQRQRPPSLLRRGRGPADRHAGRC